MLHGRLAVAEIAQANVDQLIYTVPSDKCLYAELNFDVLNSTGNDANIQIALHTGATPLNADYVEKGVLIARNGGSYLREKIIASPGENITMRSSRAGVNIRISGHLLQEKSS